MSEEQTPTGLESLDAEYKENPSIKDFTDVNQLAKAFTETKKMVGGMIRIPGEDASQEDIQAFKTKLLDAELGVVPTPDFDNPEEAAKFFLKMGAPEAPDGYTKPEGMADARFEALSQMAHAAGISAKQFTQVAGQMVEGDTAANAAIIAARDEGLTSLKNEWGEAYDQKFARAQRLAEASKAPEALLNAMKEGAVDAGTLRWLDDMAASIGGEGNHLQDLGPVTEDTRAELEAQRDELTRKLQSDERMPASERERLIAKNVALSERILALAS